MNFMPLNNTISANPTFPTTTTTQISSQPMNTTPQTYQTLAANLFSSSTSSSTASDEELEGSGGKRKRKWKAFFAKLTKEVIKKQEELQAKFLETVQRHERERMAREESWRVQEMARINREHEILLQERSNLASKDNALIAFLQKMSAQGQHNNQPPPTSQPQPPPPPPQSLPPLQQPTQLRQPPPPFISAPAALTNMEIVQSGSNNNGDQRDANVKVAMSSSTRWPKAEVQSLISLRTNLDLKYSETSIGAKGTLWEEVSLGMQKLGYNRNAKKCKEKWENINKYYKKVKDSNKKRPEDSKTCPYFHQLDALYKEKNKNETPYNSHHLKHVGSNMEPLMVQPEQQWPPPQQDKNLNQCVEAEEEEEIDDDDEEEVGETDEEEEGVGFEVVSNKPS